VHSLPGLDRWAAPVTGGWERYIAALGILSRDLGSAQPCPEQPAAAPPRAQPSYVLNSGVTPELLLPLCWGEGCVGHVTTAAPGARGLSWVRGLSGQGCLLEAGNCTFPSIPTNTPLHYFLSPSSCSKLTSGEGDPPGTQGGDVGRVQDGEPGLAPGG
jgi:hypothetical protein